MDLQDWKLIIELHNLKSLSKASERLFVSQPALTRRLKQIEEEFASIITIRTSKGITFTPQGELLVKYAENMLQQYATIKNQLNFNSKIWGTLQIAASLTQTQFFLPALLQQFENLYSGVNFEVQTMMSTQSAQALNTNKVQVAFFRGDHRGIYDQKLLATHRAYIVSGKPFTLEELPELPYISFESDFTSSTIRENWWYDNFDIAPYTAMKVKNANICYEMICHGLGYGLFLNTDFWINNKNLYYRQMFFKNSTPVTRNDWCAYRKESMRLESVSTFIYFTQKYAEELNKNRPVLDIQNF